MFTPDITKNPFDTLDLNVKEVKFVCVECLWSGLSGQLGLIQISGNHFSCCPQCDNVDIEPILKGI